MSKVCVTIREVDLVMSPYHRGGTKKLKGGPYKKGEKFSYIIQDEKTYEKTYKKIYHVYHTNTHEYLFDLTEYEFLTYFSDLEDYRENTIKELLK